MRLPVLEDTTNDADSESDLEPVDENMPPDEQTDDRCIPDGCRARSNRAIILFILQNLFCFIVVSWRK